MENRFMADILIKFIYEIQEIKNSNAWKIIKKIKIRKIIQKCKNALYNRQSGIQKYTSFDIINLALLYDTAQTMGFIHDGDLGDSCTIICHKGIAKSRWPMISIISLGLTESNQITIEAGMDNEYDNTGHLKIDFSIKFEDNLQPVSRNDTCHLDIDSIELSDKIDVDSRRINVLFHIIPNAYTTCIEALIDGMKERYLK